MIETTGRHPPREQLTQPKAPEQAFGRETFSQEGSEASVLGLLLGIAKHLW